jgi:tripartite-type tricarboxylate transporter receptor subunit TctC
MVKWVIAAVLLVASGVPATVVAQDWPTRPVTMVVPFPAGGPVDLVGRLFGQRLSEALGQQVIVENIGGAGGASGALRVAKAPPDGSQFLLGNSGTHTYSQLLTKRPPYSAVGDFTPVAVVIENSKLLVTRKDFPAATLPAFIAYARANQDKMQYGSAGIGSATHMTCVLLNAAIGIEVTHVPYRGTGPAMQDLIGGRIDYVCDVIQTSLPLIESNAIRAIALLSPNAAACLRGSRRRTNRASRISTPTLGTPSFFRRARRRRWWRGSPRRPAMSSTCRRCASAWKALVSTRPRPSAAAPSTSRGWWRASWRSGPAR